MRVDRELSDDELLGYLRAAQALSEQAQHFTLALG